MDYKPPTNDVTQQKEKTRPENLKENSLVLSRGLSLTVKHLIHTKVSLIFKIIMVVMAIFFSWVFVLRENSEKPLDGTIKLSINLLTYQEQNPLILYSTDGTNLSAFDNIFHATFENDRDVYSAILEEGKENIKRYWNRMPIALSLSNNTYNGFYSTSLHHTLPTAVNTLTNILAAEMIPSLNSNSAIFVNNYPISDIDSKDIFKNNGKSLFSIMIWSIGLTIGAFIMQFMFMPFPINEGRSFFRTLQQMTGTSPILYWLTTFLYDVAICVKLSYAAIYIMWLTDSDGIFSISDTWGVLLVHLAVHSMAGLTFMYMLSLFTNSSDMGYINLLSIVMFGVLFSAIVFFEKMSKSTTIFQGYALSFLLHILPSYSFNHGLLKIGTIGNENAICRKQLSDDLCCSRDEQTGACRGLKDYYSDSEFGISTELIYLGATTIVFITILLLREYKNKLMLFWHRQSYKYLKRQDDKYDPDITFKGVTKQYGNWWSKESVQAVTNVNIKVYSRECVGILGSNGAGKTTIFKMLVREELHSGGTITFRDPCSLSYCPQFDALDEYLTGRQVLTLFCKLRGVPSMNIKERVDDMLEMTDLIDLADIQNGIYSGGNRRKLSLAIALIGRKGGVILLDEPSSGLDPLSRRIIHRPISVAKEQNSIVMSSHSMDEFQNMCDDGIVLKNGEASSFDVGLAELMSKAGITITIKLKIAIDLSSDCAVEDSAETASDKIVNERLSPLLHSIKDNFDFQPVKKNTTTLLCLISTDNNEYADIFQKMEQIKETYSDIVDDYMINQSTVEEIIFYTGHEMERNAPERRSGS